MTNLSDGVYTSRPCGAVGLALVFGNWSNVKLDGVRVRRRLPRTCLSLLLSEAVKPLPWRERVSGRLRLLACGSHRLPLRRAERVLAASGYRRMRACLGALILHLGCNRALPHALRVVSQSQASRAQSNELFQGGRMGEHNPIFLASFLLPFAAFSRAYHPSLPFYFRAYTIAAPCPIFHGVTQGCLCTCGATGDAHGTKRDAL